MPFECPLCSVAVLRACGFAGIKACTRAGCQVIQLIDLTALRRHACVCITNLCMIPAARSLRCCYCCCCRSCYPFKPLMMLMMLMKLLLLFFATADVACFELEFEQVPLHRHAGCSAWSTGAAPVLHQPQLEGKGKVHPCMQAGSYLSHGSLRQPHNYISHS